MANLNCSKKKKNRGIRYFHKRKTIVTWIKKQKVDIAFHKRPRKLKIKLQWRSKMCLVKDELFNMT